MDYDDVKKRREKERREKMFTNLKLILKTGSDIAA